MPLWLILAGAAAVGLYLWNRAATFGFSGSTATKAGWGSGNPLAQGTPINTGSTYYVAYWFNNAPPWSSSGWTPATASDGTVMTLTPGAATNVWSPPPTAPGTWLGLLGANYIIAAATWNGPPGAVDANGNLGGATVYGTYP